MLFNDIIEMCDSDIMIVYEICTKWSRWNENEKNQMNCHCIRHYGEFRGLLSRTSSSRTSSSVTVPDWLTTVSALVALTLSTLIEPTINVDNRAFKNQEPRTKNQVRRKRIQEPKQECKNQRLHKLVSTLIIHKWTRCGQISLVAG